MQVGQNLSEQLVVTFLDRAECYGLFHIVNGFVLVAEKQTHAAEFHPTQGELRLFLYRALKRIRSARHVCACHASVPSEYNFCASGVSASAPESSSPPLRAMYVPSSSVAILENRV